MVSQSHGTQSHVRRVMDGWLVEGVLWRRLGVAREGPVRGRVRLL